MSYINLVHTLLPEYKYSSEEALSYYQRWVSNQSEDFQKKALRIFKNTTIKEKHTIAPADVIFSKRTFEESNNLYRTKAIELGEVCLKEALDRANLKPEAVDLLITTSCTGYMIPAFNAYIASNLNLKANLRQLPITELGCAAGVSALIYAFDFLKAYPDKTVAIITLEFPSNTIQLDDYSWDNVIGTALFADGVACSIISGKPEGPEIIDVDMIQVPGTTNILGYNLTNSGLLMNLTPHVPEVIEENFLNIVSSLLERNKLTINDVNHFCVHPGGVKILDKVEMILKRYNKNANTSRFIMETHGNMSSSTILFILNEFLSEQRRNETAILLSFGPGFSANQLLVKW